MKEPTEQTDFGIGEALQAVHPLEATASLADDPHPLAGSTDPSSKSDGLPQEIAFPSRHGDDELDITQYEVTKTYVDQRKVTIPPPPAKQTTSCSRILRRAIPAFQKLEIGELLAAWRNPRGLELGIIPGRTASALEKDLRKHGINPIVVDASEIHYHATVEKDGATSFLLYEDQDDYDRYCLELIARGCRVVYWES